MKLTKKLFYELQYSKYARSLPFFVVRHNGIRKTYTTNQIDHAITKYRFNRRFSPIAYATLGKEKHYLKSSKDYAPHPSWEYIKSRISSKYFKGEEFGLLELMHLSLYKFSSGAELFVDPNEYWEYIVEIEEKLGGRTTERE